VKQNPPEWRVNSQQAELVFTNRLGDNYKHLSGHRLALRVAAANFAAVWRAG